MRVIMINGWAGSGKDTMADFLVRTKGYVKESIADSLKRMISTKYKLDPWYFNTQEGKKSIPSGHNISAREILIREALKCKMEDQDFFIKKTHAELKLYDSLGYTTVVIPDFRYKSEYDYLSKFYKDIKTVCIRRHDTIPINDPSEKDLENFIFDKEIFNTGSLDDFYSSIEDYDSELNETLGTFLTANN